MPAAPRPLALAAIVSALGATPLLASENYQFLAAPDIALNRVFRVDKATGEVGACQFGLKPDAPVGVTICYPPGQGAGPQGASDYALVASRHEHEAGAWRVDLRSGAMSICYVLEGYTVCTPLGR